MKNHRLLIILISPFIISGCIGYKNYTDFKANVKSSEYAVTVTEADFENAVKSILSNTPRCFSSRANLQGDCKVYKRTDKNLEIGCYREYKGEVIDFTPYIKVDKVDTTHIKTSIYGGYITNTIVLEWIKGEHQMCPSIL